jgi:hypothetical protein
MSNTDDHIQIISSSPTGATIATDYHSGTQRHWQVVKLNTGIDGVDSLLSNANPLPVSYTNASAQTYVPVAGNTAGTDAIITTISGGNVSADIGAVTFNVGDVEISGGTIDSCEISGGTIDTIVDITTISATVTAEVSGGTIDSCEISGGTIDTIVGGTLGVSSVAIPSGFTTGHVTAGAVASTLGSNTFESGVRITNQGPDTVYIGGNSGVSTINGYKLSHLDSVFLEISNASNIYLISGGSDSDIRYIGS